MQHTVKEGEEKADTEGGRERLRTGKRRKINKVVSGENHKMEWYVMFAHI